MSIWSRIANIGRKKSGATIDSWFSEFGGSSRTASGLVVNQVTAMQASAVMACVSILSEDIAKLPVHVYRRLPNNGGKVIVADHPLELVLQRPNAWQSRFEFIEQMMAALLLRGNAYAPIIRDGRGRPIALIPVNPDRVWLYEAPDGSLFYMVARQGPHDTATLSSLPLMVPVDDMLHVRWLSMRGLWGESRIGLAREAIALSLSQQELAARLAGNNTNLGGVLQTDAKLAPDVIDRLKTQWRDKYSGMRNAGETAILEQGLKWQALGMTSHDAEFLASRNFQVAEVARIFRVPPYKLGVESRMAGNQLEQLDQDYMNNTVSSYVERWEGKLSQHFGLEADEVFVEFDISRFLRAAMQTRYTAYRTGITGTFLTPNEARRAEGLPDIPGGDELLQPVNMVPLGSDKAGSSNAGPGSDTPGAPADGGNGDPAAIPQIPTDEPPQD